MSLRCVYTDLDGTLLGAGASLFMAKPFANAELLASVRQLVGV